MLSPKPGPRESWRRTKSIPLMLVNFFRRFNVSKMLITSMILNTFGVLVFIAGGIQKPTGGMTGVSFISALPVGLSVILFLAADAESSYQAQQIREASGGSVERLPINKLGYLGYLLSGFFLLVALLTIGLGSILGNRRDLPSPIAYFLQTPGVSAVIFAVIGLFGFWKTREFQSRRIKPLES